jgi:hypothetical protein
VIIAIWWYEPDVREATGHQHPLDSRLAGPKSQPVDAMEEVPFVFSMQLKNATFLANHAYVHH